jgi:hypothetical protein
VFSLALVLVEASVGHSALEGVDAAQLFIAAADTTRRPTLRAHGIDLGDAIEAVFTTALAVDPKDRYPNAGEFWEALLVAVAQRGDIPLSLPSAGLSSRQAKATPDGITQVEGAAITGNPPLNAGSATELTASAPLASERSAASQTAQSSRSASGFQRFVAAGVLLLLLLGGLAVWRARTPTFTAQGVSATASATASASPSVERPLPAARETSASSAANAPKLDSARPASALHGFAGLPARDVPAGLLTQSGAWLDKFSILRREDQGLPFSEAFARCTDAGKTLCTDSQWQRACDAFPEVAEAPSWTESLEDARVVVRGGGSCKQRKLAGETEKDPQRIGLCCDRAVAMDSSSMQKAFLSSTAAIVLKLETALNQRSIDKFLDLSEDRLTLNAKVRDKTALKSLLTQSFASARDLVIVNDHCDVSVSAKKVVIKKSRRVKKTSYETTGWTAVCQQTRHRDGKGVAAKSSYEFSATSRLRAITDSETATAGE